MVYNGFSLDTESDGLIFEAKNFWVLCLEDLDSKEKLRIKPFEDKEAKIKFLSWLDKYDNPVICFHNGLGYDVFILKFLLDIDFQVLPDKLEGRNVQFVDTFYLSMFLNPDREGHSIEYFGKLLGRNKVEFRKNLITLGAIPSDSPKGFEFKHYHPTMNEYCEEDTTICSMVYKYLLSEWENVYGKFEELTTPFKAGQKSFFLMSCQELSGWKFDAKLGNELVIKINEMMEEIRAYVEPKLPPRSLKKTEQKDYKMPAKPFKKDGTLSSSMLKWIDKHNAILLSDNRVQIFGDVYKIEADLIPDVKLPMEMGNQDQIKQWFLSEGWQPTLYNFKRGTDGKPERDPVTRKLIRTTPKIQEQGKLCPNLEKMEGDLVSKIVKWLSLRNRLSVLTGWLDNPRLEYDGRIGAGRTGITNTHRQKHKTIVNVPKASDKVLLGKEFRSLWSSEDGFYIAAGDASALEGRVQGHFTWKYDNGETAEELLNGDPHSKNVVAFYGNIYPEVRQIYESEDFCKDDPRWKPYRDKSKNGYYCILYGGGGPKVATTLGIPEKLGNSAKDSFWEANWATKSLKDNLEKYWETKGRNKYLPAIDGRILVTRKKSALLNTIFQSCGGIVMDYASLFMDKWLGSLYYDHLRRPYYLYKGAIVRRIGYFHDELEYECQGIEIAEEVSKMIEKAIKKAGEYLKLNIPLTGEGLVGKNWKETH